MLRLAHSLIGLACLSLIGCTQSDELTRDLAAEKIEEAMQGQDYSLTEQGFNQGVSLGYWNKKGSLTANGQEIATAVSRKLITPKIPAEFTVEVTGITEGTEPAGVKEVLYSLSNKAAKGPIRYFIIAGGTGKALFQKFDDGWRIKSIDFAKSTDGLPLSDAEQKAYQAEYENEAERKTNLYSEAMSGEIQEVFKCDTSFPDRTPLQISISVSNVGAEIRERSEYRNTDWNLYFRDLRGATIEQFYGRRLQLFNVGGGYAYQGYTNCPDIDQVLNSIESRLSAWKTKWAGVDLSEP